MLPIPRDRFHGCLLGQAVGDAFGAPFEGLPADFVFWYAGSIAELLDRPPPGPRCYTDDTQMLIGVAESLLTDGEILPENLLQRFATHYQPHRGYGRGARQILEAVVRGEDVETLTETLFPGGSFGNGAAMRVAPIGLVFGHDLARVSQQATLSARTTHRHPLGIEGARLLACAVALAAAGPPLKVRDFYQQLLDDCHEEEFRWQLEAAQALRRGDSPGFLGNSLPAHRSVVTAIACFTTSPRSYRGCIEKAIALGDDTDTLAAMAGALSGAFLGEAALPAPWIDELESGPHGRDYIRQLADQLHALHARLLNPTDPTVPG